MQLKQFLILAVSFTIISGKCKNGGSQSPVSKKVNIESSISNTSFSVAQLFLNNLVQVKYNTSVIVGTLDASGNVITFSSAVRNSNPIISGTTPGAVGATPQTEIYTMNMPSAVSGFKVEARLSYNECGTKNPQLSVPNTQGGKTFYKALSPLFTAPQNITIKKSDFSIINSVGC